MPKALKESPWRTVFVVAGLGVYLTLFYAARMPTLEQVTGDTFRRVDYWQFLLLPEMLLHVWFGNPMEFALLDRLPVLIPAVLIVAYAAALGWVLLTVLDVDSRLGRLESFVFSTATGLATLSTYTLAVGLLGWLRNPMAFVLPAILSLALFSRLWLHRATDSIRQAGRTVRGDHSGNAGEKTTSGLNLDGRWLWLAAPFVLVILLGGVLPPVHFDVLEYHLQTPKEFYALGEVGFLPHNVYANMPLGASMFALLAMSMTGDWWLGALIGKTIVALTAPLTALALLAAGRRLHSNAVGVTAAVVYLATPWIAHVAMAGLAESPLAMYAFLATYAAVFLPRDTLATASPPASVCKPSKSSPTHQPPVVRRGTAWRSFLRRYASIILAGYLAGAAAGCKYPAVLFLIVPLLAWTALTSGKRNSASRNESAPLGCSGAVPGNRFHFPIHLILRTCWKPLTAFSCAVALGGGLWYAKNWFVTGNPTYPLLFELFGDSTGTWATESNVQWDRVHSPGNFSPITLTQDLVRVFLASEWLSPLLFPLALLAIVARRPQRTDLLLIGYFGWVVCAWWLLTHRIDRFWIPWLAVAAILAGVGATWTKRTWWRRVFLSLFVLTSLASLLVAVAPAPGNYKRFFLPLQRARTDPLRVDAWHRYFNAQPPEGRLLLVGDAAVFNLNVPVLYSTCFGTTPLRQLAEGETPHAIRRRMAEADISHVLVHWGEIARYRATYGFDPRVQPALLDQLVKQRVLAPLPTIEAHPARAYRVLPP